MENLFIGIVCTNPVGLARLPQATGKFMQDMVCRYRELGYETWLFSNEQDADALPNSTSIRAFIDHENSKYHSGRGMPHGLYGRSDIFVYFCGHGFSRSRSEQFWILEQGASRPEDRVDVSALREVLEGYGPQQIRLFGDACAEPAYLQGGGTVVFPSSATPVLDTICPVDIFLSSANGATTLADSAGPLFSQVIRRALLDGPPIETDALDLVYTNHVGHPIITNESLRAYVRPRFKNLAAMKNAAVTPWMVADTGYPENVYRKDMSDVPIGGLGGKKIDFDKRAHVMLDAAVDFESDGESPTFERLEIPEVLGAPEVLDIFVDQEPWGFSEESNVYRDLALKGWPGSTVAVSASVQSSLNSLEGSVAATRGYEPPLSNPTITQSDVNQVLLGFSWGARSADEFNGSSLIRVGEASFVVPEFASFTTIVSLEDWNTRERAVYLAAVRDEAEKPKSLRTYGGALFRRLASKQTEFNTLKIVAEYARSRLLEDPLTPIAYAYYLDAIGRRKDIIPLISSLEERGLPVTIDLPLLAQMTIRYHQDDRVLSTQGCVLATEIPVMSRGWSRLLQAYDNSIFSELRPLQNTIAPCAHAVFTLQSDHEFVMSWLQKYFGEKSNLKPLFGYTNTQFQPNGE